MSFRRRHPVFAGLGISVGIGWVIALIGQTLLPVLAKLPGLVLCAGGGFDQ